MLLNDLKKMHIKTDYKENIRHFLHLKIHTMIQVSPSMTEIKPYFIVMEDTKQSMLAMTQFVQDMLRHQH